MQTQSAAASVVHVSNDDDDDVDQSDILMSFNNEEHIWIFFLHLKKVWDLQKFKVYRDLLTLNIHHAASATVVKNKSAVLTLVALLFVLKWFIWKMYHLAINKGRHHSQALARVCWTPVIWLVRTEHPQQLWSEHHDTSDSSSMKTQRDFFDHLPETGQRQSPVWWSGFHPHWSLCKSPSLPSNRPSSKF